MKLSEITKSKLKSIGVKVVYLFGSRATGTALEKSDHDVGVVFDAKKVLADNPSLFTNVYEILSNEFPDEIRGSKLDISFLQRASAALEMSAISEGVILFEDNPVFRADYEESVVKRYDDYQPIKKEYEEATFAAFGY